MEAVAAITLSFCLRLASSPQSPIHTPITPPPLPRFRQPFRHQFAAKAAAAAHNGAQAAAVFVQIAGAGLEFEGASVQQRDQAAGRGVAQLLFVGAFRAVGFGGVDVGDADLFAR